eukprot:gene22371-28966_t
MSSNVIIIQSGQCGNQIGYEIINQLSSLKSNRVYSRSISIDTEPKVINQCITNSKQSKLWQIDPRSIVYRHGGAGNNWALDVKLNYVICHLFYYQYILWLEELVVV